MELCDGFSVALHFNVCSKIAVVFLRSLTTKTGNFGLTSKCQDYRFISRASQLRCAAAELQVARRNFYESVHYYITTSGATGAQFMILLKISIFILEGKKVKVGQYPYIDHDLAKFARLLLCLMTLEHYSMNK